MEEWELLVLSLLEELESLLLLLELESLLLELESLLLLVLVRLSGALPPQLSSDVVVLVLLDPLSVVVDDVVSAAAICWV